ncbi:MAG: bifunctional salicylyl-CoA 5-hydroxylase/oxidoreductase [Ktedonobacterales bacterium]
MKVVVLGAGPAGLYCALLLKKANAAHDVTVIERNPADATYGWGVVFSDRTLAAFQEADYRTYRAITDQFVLWDTIDVRYQGQVMHCGGHVFAGIPRKLLLQILQRRCAAVGVQLRFGTEVAEVGELDGYDLVIAADGVNSLVRRTYTHVFRPTQELGQAKYIWLGTDKVLDAFTFIFRENEHGLFQVHAYPFGGATSTFIVECAEATWRRAELDVASEAASIAYCERLFAPDLSGAALLSNNSRWISFPTITTHTWHLGNWVLLGDAAHTAHFSIGSGTKLAMEDAIALVNALQQHGTIEAALSEYELERKPVVEAFQAAARDSQRYFEHVGRYSHLEPIQFSFHLLTRSGRVSYDDLRVRDPRYVEAADRWFAGQAMAASDTGQRPIVAPAPAFTPLRLRHVTLPNRMVFAPTSTSASEHGSPADAYLAELGRLAEGGAGLLMTDIVAVSDTGRITPTDAGIYRAGHLAAWRRFVAHAHAHSPARVALQLGHAGRRGSTRPRGDGLDRPLRAGGWPLLAASPLPYTPWSQTPREMDRADMDRVRDAFVRAARLGAEAGFDLLQLHCAHGYLLASFLSPLTNQRLDQYGGPLENRLRFPLEVFDAVRASWPAERPLGVALSATDWRAGGSEIADAVVVAKMLAAHGCDWVTVLAGQTTTDAEPPYGRGFLTPLADRLRNEARVTTMVGGYLTTTGEVNTILAAGRADLCILAT